VDVFTILWIGMAGAGLVAAAKFGPSLASFAGFTYPNAKFNAIGAPYLQEKELARLVSSDSLEDFQANVVSRDFSVEGESIREVQRAVDMSLARIIAMARKDSPKTVHAFYDAFLQTLDARLIKDALRSVLEGSQAPEQEPFSSLGQMVREGLRQADREEMLRVLSEVDMLEVKQLIETEAPVMAVEYAVDRYLVQALGRAEVPRSCARTRNVFAKRLIDVMNLKAILRATYYGLGEVQQMLFGEGREIPGWQVDHMLKIDSIPEVISLLEGTSYGAPLRDVLPQYERQGLWVLELAIDRQFVRHAAAMGLDDTTGLGPGIRFLVEKQYEARNLKAIAKGVGEGLDAEKIWNVVVTT